MSPFAGISRLLQCLSHRISFKSFGFYFNNKGVKDRTSGLMWCTETHIGELKANSPDEWSRQQETGLNN